MTLLNLIWTLFERTSILVSLGAGCRDAVYLAALSMLIENVLSAAGQQEPGPRD